MTNHQKSTCTRPNTEITQLKTENSKIRRAGTAAGVVTGAALALTFSSPSSYAASHLPGMFSGQAVALFSNVTTGPVASRLGAAAQIDCPCQGTLGKTLTYSTGPITAGTLGLLSVTATKTSVDTGRSVNAARIAEQSQVTQLSMFGGLITADALTSEAALNVTTSTMTPATTGSTFVNLKIAGKLYPSNIKPNTVMLLPGLGTVTLNAQTITKSPLVASSVRVDMISVNITQPNGFGLPLQTHINVGTTLAGYTRQQPAAAVNGTAFATFANEKSSDALVNSIGRTASVDISCQGTGGKQVVNTADALDVANILSVANARSTALSGPSGGGTISRTTSTVKSLKLLGGLISGTDMRAIAQEKIVGGTLQSSTAGSGFGTLKIAGVTISATVSPNTTIALPGFGSVIVNQQIKGIKPGDGTTVNGLHIGITVPNLLNIPVGAQIYVAHANAGASNFTP